MFFVMVVNEIVEYLTYYLRVSSIPRESSVSAFDLLPRLPWCLHYS